MFILFVTVPFFRKMSELENISHHIGDRISTLRRHLPQNMKRKLGQECFALERLLEEFEKCVGQQKEQLRSLKELEELFKKDVEDVHHMKDNIPAHMPMKKGPVHGLMTMGSGNEHVMTKKEAAEVQPAQTDDVKKTNKSYAREMEFITMPEFEKIPQYMKGRVSYDQLNAAVQSINTAVTAKYKIFHQSVRSLNNHSRKLYQRFKDQEMKDTKGQYFVVEDDIREFTQVRVDKRFQGILNMLRHCQRLRELRGGGLTRFLLL
uniref:SKA complex subunit 1 n=1 Tax=Scophthalmus maximus TaxID=52904 RepID=A0A8D3DLQ7_SCOMX